MERIDISKHTKYSLEFIFSEADKMAVTVLKSISENTNKSFVLFALYGSILPYSFMKGIKYDIPHAILFLGAVISSLILIKNLFPSKVSFRGTFPSLLVTDYFDNFTGKDLEKEYLAVQIDNYNYAISENIKRMKAMVKRFIYSAINMLLFILFFILFNFFLFI